MVVLDDPDVALDYSRVVHGEQRFTHHRPIRAGDRLVATTTIDAARTVAGNDLLTARVDLATEDGEAGLHRRCRCSSRGGRHDVRLADVAVGTELPEQVFRGHPRRPRPLRRRLGRLQPDPLERPGGHRRSACPG